MKIVLGVLIAYGLLAINFQLGLYTIGIIALWWGLNTDYWKRQTIA